MSSRSLETTRVIARLDGKDNWLVKPVHLDGLRRLGLLEEFAQRYSEQCIDEIFYVDAVASLYGTEPNYEVIGKIGQKTFVPLTVCGGIRSVEDALRCLESGADKIAVNTASLSDPNLIESLAKVIGSQSVVISVEAAATNTNKVVASCCSGKELSNWDLLEWVQRAQDLGAGEVVLTSVAHEGTRTGFDLGLIAKVEEICRVPLIVSGGMGTATHAYELLNNIDVDGFAVADFFHFGRGTISDLKNLLKKQGFRMVLNG